MRRPLSHEMSFQADEPLPFDSDFRRILPIRALADELGKHLNKTQRPVNTFLVHPVQRMFPYLQPRNYRI